MKKIVIIKCVFLAAVFAVGLAYAGGMVIPDPDEILKNWKCENSSYIGAFEHPYLGVIHAGFFEFEHPEIDTTKAIVKRVQVIANVTEAQAMQLYYGVKFEVTELMPLVIGYKIGDTDWLWNYIVDETRWEQIKPDPQNASEKEAVKKG